MFREIVLGAALNKLKASVTTPLRLVLPDGTEHLFSASPSVTVRLGSKKAVKKFFQPSLLTLAEAYIEREIEIDGAIGDIIQVAISLSRYRESAPYVPLSNGASQHSKSRDRAAVQYHYDVSNDFYALWLDRRMVYSCAYFKDAADSLGLAQEQKLDHICRKLQLRHGDRFLDIGCGWGALPLWAAQRYGAHATGITLSQKQHDFAQESIHAAGLQGKCRVILQDYREHPGVACYDRIASVGMFEHVGLANLAAYFATVNRLLANDGLFLNHGITTMDCESRAVGLGGGEFIDKYVFPSGELPHISQVLREMSAQDFEVVDVEGLRAHYALTLRHWSRQFEAAIQRAVELTSERTARIWRLYLAGCAYSFEQGWTSIYQVLAGKQSGACALKLPLTRDYMYPATP
jgi:cyclopropane-fatty-acyl-phospholipid synthase